MRVFSDSVLRAGGSAMSEASNHRLGITSERRVHLASIFWDGNQKSGLKPLWVIYGGLSQDGTAPGPNSLLFASCLGWHRDVCEDSGFAQKSLGFLGGRALFEVCAS